MGLSDQAVACAQARATPCDFRSRRQDRLCHSVRCLQKYTWIKAGGVHFWVCFFIGLSISLNFGNTDQAHSNAALLTLETFPDCLLTLLATNQLAQTRTSQMYSYTLQTK